MARFSTMQEAETPEQKRKRLEQDTLTQTPEPDAAAMQPGLNTQALRYNQPQAVDDVPAMQQGLSVLPQDLNIPSPKPQPRFSTQGIAENNVEAAKHVIAPEATPDPNAQFHSQSSPESKIPAGLGLMFDPRSGASDENFAEMNRRIAGIPNLEESRNRMMDAPTGLGHKLMGIGAAIGGSLLGGNAMQMYDLGAHGPQRAAAKPLTDQLQITQDMLGAMKEFEPLATARVNAENMRGQVQKMNTNDLMKVGQYSGEDGKMHFVYAYKSNPQETFELDSNGNMKPAAVRGVFGSTMSVKSALENGKRIVELEDGTQFDLATVPNPSDMQVSMLSNGKWVLGNQSELSIQAGGMVGIRGRFENQPGEITPIGQSRTGTTTTAPATILNKNNEYEQLPGRSTPSVPGFTGGGNPPPPAPFVPPVPAQANPGGPQTPSSVPAVNPPPAVATPGLSGQIQPMGVPAAPGLAARRTPAPAAGGQGKPTTPGGRVLPGVPMQDVNRQSNIAIPMRVAAAAVIGDKNHPDAPSMAKYAYLADDAGSRERVGTVLGLLLDDINRLPENEATGLINKYVPLGGIGTLLANKTGLPEWVSKSNVQLLTQAASRLRPDEQQYINTVINAKGNIIGMRVASKAGAYQFSTENLERELPIIGRGEVTSSLGYNTKLGLVARDLSFIAHQPGMMMFPKEELDYWDSEYKRLTDLTTQAPPGQPGGGQNQRRFRIER